MAEHKIYEIDKRLTAVENKSIITAGITSNFVVSTAGNNTVPVNKEICKKGSAFSIKNGKIYVDTDISYVKVSGNIGLNAKARSATALNFSITKNGEDIAMAMSTVSENIVTNQTRAISQVLVNVKKGDYFEIQIYAQADEFVMNQSTRTYITIEEVV